MADKMVRHSSTLHRAKLGRPDGHTAVDLTAIGTDDFTVERLSDREGPLALPRSRGANHCNERRIHGRSLGSLRPRNRAGDREKLLRVQGRPTH